MCELESVKSAEARYNAGPRDLQNMFCGTKNVLAESPANIKNTN